MAELLLAKPVIANIKTELKNKCTSLKTKNIIPTLQVVLVGNNNASVLYTKKKKSLCETIGANAEIIQLSDTITEEAFLSEINKISLNPRLHGLFIQLPLPPQLEHLDVGSLVPPHIDVDGFHPQNLYALLNNLPSETFFTPCTPKGIMTLLDYYNIPVIGKKIAILGRSMIVGKPLALLMTNNNATVTLCHSRSVDLHKITQNSDIIVSAIGKAKFLDASFINSKANQIIIDVGTNQDENGNLCGDVDFEKVEPLVKAITPVPGGIGPLTVHSLCQNLLQAAEKNI